MVSLSDKQQITVELYSSDVLVWLCLSVIGIWYSRTSWNLIVQALFGWVIADAVADAMERKTEGKFTVQIKVRSKRLFRKRLPFPHRITVAYLLYPVGIGVALLYGELVPDLMMQTLPSIQQRTSLVNLISQLIGKTIGYPQEFFVASISFILGIILFRDFRSRMKK